MSRTFVCGLAAALAIVAFPASVMAAPKEGSVTDPAGDAAAQRDITDVKVRYDPGGIVTNAKAKLAFHWASASDRWSVTFARPNARTSRS